MRVMLLIALCVPAFAAAETITVSAAISLSEVLKEVAGQFERDRIEPVASIEQQHAPAVRPMQGQIQNAVRGERDLCQ